MESLSQLTPEQRQAVMYQAQQEANQSLMQEMVKQMVAGCFEKCTGQSVSVYLNHV
jgi:Tim10/DDP family zinc finger